MSKYSFEFKLKIVKEYLSGEGGYKYLVKKHNIANGNAKNGKSQVRNWVKIYQEFGEEGLYRKRKVKNE